MKVLTVVGARPQFIKAAPVSAALIGRAEEVLVHTGQHYDADMSQGFFDELGLAAPAYALGIRSGSHGDQTGRMLAAVEEVIISERPDWVLVYGDTNSTLAGALAAAKLDVHLAHVEAGLRSFDRAMPEEVNRVVCDHVADLCLAPSPTAMKNLAAEGITGSAVQVGDVMVDALERVARQLPPLPPLLAGLALEPGGYLVATLHRAATTDDPARLRRAVGLLRCTGIPVVVPLHPRTRAALERTGLLPMLTECGRVRVLPPQGYAAMLGLVARARAVLTDSGGLQKEAYLLGTPCLTLRAETEWVETVDLGWNHLVDLDPDRVAAALNVPPPANRPRLYGDGHAADRVVTELLSRRPS